MILQLNPTILVDTPLGRGHAIFLIDYGMHQNSCWVVALSDNGIVKHFDANDVVVATNYTYGMNLRHHHPEYVRSVAGPSAVPPAGAPAPDAI